MSGTRTRRTPTQERSRRTVERILEAAEAIVAERGVDAATTRAISERAGVAAPSLYRFFADRDEVLDALLERMLADLDEHAQAAEAGFAGETIEAFVRLEVELHVDYYEQHPSLAELWFGGRVSPRVVAAVRARNRALATRARDALTGAGLVDPATPPIVFELLIEYGDRTVDLAFRGDGAADREVVEAGIAALTAQLEPWGTRAR
ncbi:MAG TPA: TetR/AcrR family transcriptional regulator [Solirubrobacteraceae bacterium]|nr:TetR/AcrR family transcriptional regulator [Solirubrobacteraceae bacterium]